MLCPGCGQLVGVNDARCLGCGRIRPGLFGFAQVLRDLGHDLGFADLVMWSCGALYLAALASNPGGIGTRGLLSLLSPSTDSLLLFGASGALPVYVWGRWWTVLAATWLHGGLLHIIFNMLWVRDLVPAVSHLYGPARTIILYTFSGAVGFGASTVAVLLPLPGPLRGAGITVGASGAVFGLIGALLYYGKRGGSALVREHAKRWALAGLAMGFMMPGVDNWAHLGGLAGGWIAARWLDPLMPERTDHVIVALVCLLASAAAVAYSIVSGLRLV